MKFFIILALAGSCVCLRAQTNTPPTAQPPETVITSDSGRFNGITHQMFYTGHVVVIDPKAKLWCGQLTVDLPAEGGRPTNILALTNVVIDMLDEKGQTNHITANKAVYTYSVANSVTNEVIVFTGGDPMPKAENSQVIVLGDPLTLNLITKQYEASNYKTIFKQAPNSGHGTNASPFNILK